MWILVFLTQYCAGDNIEKNVMGGACSAFGRGERRVQGFGRENRKRDHWGDPGADGKMILRWIFRTCDGAWNESIWLRIGTGGGHL
jgi:hypothetical protein